ncbi:MAG: hypothetical protein V1806_06225 [Pseudomonadota bacterium]
MWPWAAGPLHGVTVLCALGGAALCLAGLGGRLAGRLPARGSRLLNGLGYGLCGVSLLLFVLRGLGA